MYNVDFHHWIEAISGSESIHIYNVNKLRNSFNFITRLAGDAAQKCEKSWIRRRISTGIKLNQKVLNNLLCNIRYKGYSIVVGLCRLVARLPSDLLLWQI